MKNKRILTIGIISLIIFIGLATYLWYLYFSDYEKKLISQDAIDNITFANSIELVNSGGTNYANATNKDDDAIIPVYYFRVSNKSDKEFEYVLLFENVTVNDGCTPETTLKRSELEYELRLNDSVIQKGDLDSVDNDILETNTIASHSNNDYALKVKIKDNVTNYNDKHFHYVVTIKENK